MSFEKAYYHIQKSLGRLPEQKQAQWEKMKSMGREHNYPKTRKPTGPRPNAGPKPKLKEPVRFTAIVEAHHLKWLDSQGDRQEALRQLIEAAINAK